MLDPRKMTWLRPNVSLLVILLLTLGLSAVLAYQAQHAARSHRRAAEAALRDYAAFASWELGRRAEAQLMNALTDAAMGATMGLENLGRRRRVSQDVESYPVAVRRVLAWCECPQAVYNFFEIDLRQGRLQVSDTASAAFRQWIAALPSAQLIPAPTGRLVLRQEIHQEMQQLRGPGTGRTVLRMDSPRVRSGVVDGQRISVVYVLEYENEVPSRAFGFAFHPAQLAAPVLARISASIPLLPASLTGGAPNGQVLAIDAFSTAGDTILRSSDTRSGTPAVMDTLAGAFAEVRTRVAVRPEVADRLVIGGLPRSRLPLLLGVLALTLGLVGAAAVQIRRQQELVRLRSDFVSGVSHELRTPLAQIRLFADLLESGRLRDEQRRRSVRIINEEARRLTYLVENVLRFSRAERHADRIAPEPTEVAPLLRTIVESFAPLARARNAQLVTELRDGIVCRLDRDALHQVLLNLLDNAVKYGPVGQRIGVGLEADRAWVRIWVDDQGPGVPSEERERVWEPYRRLARDAESATGGSGIGLAVVRELVELHGGRTRIEDAPAGNGARFIVELPRTTPAPASTPENVARREVGV